MASDLEIYIVLFLVDLSFWPRATLKGPKRSFDVVVLILVLVGVGETWTKNIPYRTKNVRNWNALNGTKDVP